MKLFKKNTFLSIPVVVSYSLGFPSNLALAQENERFDEEVISIGTRSSARSATDSPAAVDVIGAAEFSSQGGNDLQELFRNVVPSYNVNQQPISDGATIVRPANLRGLSPDHTLVLLNGKRRHRASIITWQGNGISNGSQGPDISVFPSIALKNVEVLRDGAAAQYGSDAIAGVINFNIKDDSQGGSFEVKLGEYAEGDGQKGTIAGNIGLPLGANGFINLSAEYSYADPTDRSTQRTDAIAVINNGFPARDPAQIWGLPEIEDDIKALANFAIELSPSAELYGHTNYASKTVTGGFFFRNPLTRSGVNGYTNDNGTPSDTSDDFSALLVGDLTADGSGNCNTDIRVVGGMLDAQGLAELADVQSDPNCFHFTELFPGGFTPFFGGDAVDYSFLTGLRGETEGGLSWDISGYLGHHEVDFFIGDTVNASLGPNTPTSFDPGKYAQTDINVNADFGYELSDTVFFAWGAEWREEEFEITAGQAESFAIGPLADQGFSTGSNGFAGFPTFSAGEFTRENIALYFDTEVQLTDSWLGTAAVRWEDFDGFGTTTNYKIGSNYQFNDSVGIRSTFSTGFKAPTPGQINAFNVTTEFQNGVLVSNGTVPSTNPIALLRGGRELEPEESQSFTAGLFFSVGVFDITLDYFNIKVDERLNLSTEFELTDAEQISLDASIPGAGSVNNFRFFTNDFDTETSGVDLVVSTSSEWLGGTTEWNFVLNNTNTDITDFNTATVDATRVREVEEGVPTFRSNISATHLLENWRILTRLSRYGSWYDSEDDIKYSGEFLVDAELAYNVTSNSEIIIGANNIFDQEPENNPNATSSGNTFSQYTPFDFNGAFWYARYRYSF
ncbi:TonB-dependent receptor plug domain-containing protein [Agarilytica rhodophyticola]|uniref:TonB-dependent receptor plug domain-containing protein n=1 Tax=Agarilytica rhodophyticola TaxID=1737490 RepID=UPI000B349395|nr:TonB-dependent receptor [Agarilytica rhodophyticola]